MAQQQQQYPMQQAAGGQTTVVVVQQGNCPVCKAGYIVEEFTCCGIVLAILFFPLGLLCCFLMRERKCSSCGARL